MLAAQYSENSEDLSVIQVQQVEKPVAQPGHIVVKVHTAAINPIDPLVAKGFAKNVLGWTMPLPFTMGYDFAGVVTKVTLGSPSVREYLVSTGALAATTMLAPPLAELSQSTYLFLQVKSASFLMRLASTRVPPSPWWEPLPTRSSSMPPS